MRIDNPPHDPADHIYRWDGAGYTPLDDPIHWVGVFTHSTSLFGFHVTHNGASDGIAIFQDLAVCTIELTCERNTSDLDEAPWAYVNSITNEGRTVNTRAMRSNTNTVVIGGSTQGSQPNGNAIRLHVHIFGQRNSEVL